MMTKEQLDAIKERVENATPGEWSMGFCYDRLLGTYLLYAGKDKCILSTHKNPSNQDAEFIAHARQDVPALIAEVERLREALEFYAVQGTYEPVYSEDLKGNLKGVRPIVKDSGDTARKALQHE